MVTTITRFALPPGVPAEAINKGLREVAPHFTKPRGLIRKYFLVSLDGTTGGGVYLWKSLEVAREFSEGPLRAMIRDAFKVEASITYFNTPVIVDNVTSEILSGDTPETREAMAPA